MMIFFDIYYIQNLVFLNLAEEMGGNMFINYWRWWQRATSGVRPSLILV